MHGEIKRGSLQQDHKVNQARDAKRFVLLGLRPIVSKPQEAD